MDNYLIRNNFKYFDHLEHFTEESKTVVSKLDDYTFPTKNNTIDQGTKLEFNLIEPVYITQVYLIVPHTEKTVIINSYDQDGNKITEFSAEKINPKSSSFFSETDKSELFNEQGELKTTPSFVKTITVEIKYKDDFILKRIDVIGLTKRKLDEISSKIKSNGGIYQKLEDCKNENESYINNIKNELKLEELQKDNSNDYRYVQSLYLEVYNYINKERPGMDVAFENMKQYIIDNKDEALEYKILQKCPKDKLLNEISTIRYTSENLVTETIQKEELACISEGYTSCDNKKAEEACIAEGYTSCAHKDCISEGYTSCAHKNAVEKNLIYEETIKSHEAKDLIDEEIIEDCEAKDLIDEKTIKSHKAKIVDLETKLLAIEASKFEGALPDKDSVQNKIQKIKFEFIMKNYFTNKFNLIDFTLNRSLVDKDMVLIFAEVDTDKGVTKILASLDRSEKIKLEGPMDLSFTAGYLIIFYIIMILMLLILLFKK